jgi:SHS2 domain-containing protein
VYRWVEHTAELELEIEAKTEAEVFADALAALGELLGDERPGTPEHREVELHGSDRAALLADLLDELVYLADAEAFVPEQLIELGLEDGALRATVGGHRGEPRPIVKAVTRHGLEFRPAGSGWRARLVLDV